MGLKDYLDKKDREYNKQERLGRWRPWHSRAYHKHFMGYSERYVTRADGKGMKIERIYTGHYYRRTLSNIACVKTRVVYCLCFLAGAVLFIYGAAVPVKSNFLWYVTLPEAAAIPCLFLTAFSLVMNVSAPADMTIPRYIRSVRNLQRYAALSSGCIFTAAFTTLFFLFDDPEATREAWICLLLFIVSGASFLTITLIEAHVHYDIIPNPVAVPDEGIEIG